MNFEPQVVILSGGDYPSHPTPVALLQQAHKVVCCDGAVFDLLRHKGTPWRIVGDCDTIFSTSDSEEIEMVEAHRDIIRHIEEQDDNDQTKAVRYCLEHGIDKIAIVGATGRREDHTLGNISLIAEYMAMGADVRLYTDYGYFIPVQGKLELDIELPKGFKVVSDTEATRQKSVQISIFNISAHGFRSEGLRYPLYDFTQWWQGTLNEAIVPHITIEAEGLYIVFVTYQ